MDPDDAVPVPPALFSVDYVDSPSGGGGATITVPELSAVRLSGLAVLILGLLSRQSLASVRMDGWPG